MIEELRIGIIGKVHGLKGELKVFPTTEDPKRFSSLKEVILKKEEDGLFARKDREVREVSSVRFHKDMVLLQLKGIDTIEKAEQYRNFSIFVKREDAIPLEEGEHYLGDYLGMQVFVEERESIGHISDIIETGANLVFVVRGGEKEYLIPHVPSIVYAVRENEVHIHAIPGLLEL